MLYKDAICDNANLKGMEPFNSSFLYTIENVGINSNYIVINLNLHGNH